VTACSPTSTPQSTSVEDVLDAFGIDHTATPRLDDNLEQLPADFAPLGGRMTIGRFDELVLFGIQLDDPRLGPTGAMPVVDLVPGANNSLTPSLLAVPAATPWLTGSIPRAAARGDFDRDGIDEIAVVYREVAEPIRLVVLDGTTIQGPFVVGLDAVTELFVTSGDFDGDLSDDLLVAQVTPGAVDLRLIRNLPGGWAADVQGPSLPVTSSDVGVVLAAGNLDRDLGFELAMTINERTSSSASARHAIYDDAGTGFAVLGSGPVTVTTPTEVVTVRAAGVAIGDVDGDGVDEIVFGGLTEIGNTCNLTTSYAVEIRDDRRSNLARLAAHTRPWLDTRQPCSSGAQHRMEMMHVLTADLDGDGASEIVTNEYIYDDLRATAGALQELHVLPQSELLTRGTSGSDVLFTWRTSAFTAGDVTSDRREDLVFYTQRDSAQVVQVWSDDQVAGWSKRAELHTRFANASAALRPQILLADVDLDAGSMAIEFSEGSHRLVFTEPVLIAALAAAPCYAGQDVDGACRTAFGKAVSETNTRTDSWSVIAGVSVGYESEFSPLGVKVGGAEAIVNTRNTLRMYTTEAYTLTRSVLRETGPSEDSVIFMTVPLDVFTYTILSHPNPELVGGKLEIRMPRSPITILAEREFYNAHILPDAFHVDASVFAHSAGDPASYRRAASKTELLGKFTGVASEQVDVGQGSGRTLVSISRLDQTSTGKAFDFQATLDLRATSGVVVGGFSVGGGAGFDLSITRGTEMIYQGSVANLPAAKFPGDAYRFGLFTYLYDEPGTAQKFEVVDYWVEPF
jgi:hypothetical protein